jgi:integrase
VRSAAQVAKLFQGLDADENVVEALAIRMLVATGCRRMEIFSLRWENVDLPGRVIFLPASMTKAGRARVVVANDLAAETLERAEKNRKAESPFVFPVANKLGHVAEAKKTFTRAKRRAGIDEGVRLHDLRHTFASLAAQVGVPLYEIQKLLGHSSSQMTQRYAHLQDDTLRRASETVAAEIGKATSKAA